MWRNSVKGLSSSRLLFSTAGKPGRFPLNPNACQTVYGGLWFQSQLHFSSAEVSSSVDSVKLGLASGCSTGFSSSLAGISGSSTSVSFSKPREFYEVIRQYGRCYWELSKARLSMLVVATSGAGFVLGSGGVVDFAGLCWTCTGTMMVAAAASSLNQVFEVNNDAKMKRTRQRPLPSGRLSVPHAVIWASSLGLAGTSILACKANLLTAGLAASNLFLYAFIYTPLKQVHPANTWVGAIVGAIPPLLGWTAATGEVSLVGMILPAALYFWQLPHFMALAYWCRNDYAAGGFRMLSLFDASGQRTSSVALRNCLYLLPLGFLAYDWGLTSEWFCAESTLLTLAMSATAFSFYRDRTTENARRMFRASLLYLPVLMGGMLFHRLPNTSHQEIIATDSDKLVDLPFSEPHLEVSNSNDNPEKTRRELIETHARSPVSYASVAPFPFLPAPLYASPDL
ncbi:protoheme IX farnesyltransferase, mitochondrial [Aristolochia californica]|uniref:protoheme IX farnesyltransferase, mitochondrial n=1 Tax=Aristolochia californica TaxID=171875 RepID=UPI0035E2E230